MKMHYVQPNFSWSACGNVARWAPNATEDRNKVTCKNCYATDVFKGTDRLSVAAKNVDFTVTEDVEKAFAYFNKIASEVATKRNYCDEYDRLVEQINALLPSGLALADRRQDFTVEVRVGTDIFKVVRRARSAEEAEEMVDNEMYAKAV